MHCSPAPNPVGADMDAAPGLGGTGGLPAPCIIPLLPEEREGTAPPVTLQMQSIY